MSVEVLDGATIREFVEDDQAFNTLVSEHFATLDTDRDGLLSHTEMVEELKRLRVLETHFGVDDVKLSPDELVGVYDALFDHFDHDGSDTVDQEEFMEEIKKVMLAVANGLGFLPVQMVLEEGSFLKRAVDWESARLLHN